MQLILKPRSIPELDEIIVTEKLFAVGRSEAPFNTYSKSAVAKLSKRHARLFAQDGVVYVADLGSLNGTLCNDQPVKNEPHVVEQGDILSFGGLAYEVEIVTPPSANTAEQNYDLRLILVPESLGGDLEPIVITSFPFLINKNSDVFARYRESLPEEISYLSRRHAHIFIVDDQLRIEDLGSTNGTFVNGAQLDEHVHELKDGDSVAFGSDRLVYRAHVLRASDEDKTQAPEQLAESADMNRTIFVDSPTSFIDIYFVEGGGVAEPSQGAQSDKNAVQAASKESLFKQLKRAMFGESLFGTKARWGVGVVLVGAIGLGSFSYWRGAQMREVEALLAAQKYELALASADALLEQGNDDARLRDLAAQAMVGFAIPDWIEHYQQADFEAARDVLALARQKGQHNDRDDVLLDALQWSADARQFLKNRRDLVQSKPFEDADQVNNLLNTWTQASQTYTRELGLLSPLNADFPEVYESIFADISSLRRLALDTGSLHELANALAGDLTAGRADDAVRRVEDLLEDKRDFAGVAVLREDLNTLKRLQNALGERDWLQAMMLVTDHQFRTVPFREYALGLEREVLPDAATLQAFGSALDLWRAGKFDQSEQVLQELTQTKWPDLADRRIAEQKRLRSELNALQASRGADDYPERLFAFYSALDEKEDEGLIQLLREDFTAHANAARENASENYAGALRQWRRYDDLGRIQTAHRFNNVVTGKFIELAGLLSGSSSQLQRALQVHEQLALEVPAEWQVLAEDLRNEIAIQRNLLTNVQVVSEAVRKRKLDALPQ